MRPEARVKPAGLSGACLGRYGFREPVAYLMGFEGSVGARGSGG